MPERESCIRAVTYAHEVEIASTDDEISSSAIMQRSETGGAGEYLRGDSREGVISLAKRGFRGALAIRKAHKTRAPRLVRSDEQKLEKKGLELYVLGKVDALIARSGKLTEKDNNRLPLDLTATITGEKREGDEVQILAPGSWAGPISNELADELFPDRPDSRGVLRAGVAVMDGDPDVEGSINANYIHRELDGLPDAAKSASEKNRTTVFLVLLNKYTTGDPKYNRDRGHIIAIEKLDSQKITSHEAAVLKLIRGLDKNLKHIEAEGGPDRRY